MSSVARFAYFSPDVRDEESGDPLWWSNQDGWGSIHNATLFTDDEIKEHIDTEHSPRLNGNITPHTQIDCEIPEDI